MKPNTWSSVPGFNNGAHFSCTHVQPVLNTGSIHNQAHSLKGCTAFRRCESWFYISHFPRGTTPLKMFKPSLPYFSNTNIEDFCEAFLYLDLQLMCNLFLYVVWAMILILSFSNWLSSCHASTPFGWKKANLCPNNLRYHLSHVLESLM